MKSGSESVVSKQETTGRDMTIQEMKDLASWARDSGIKSMRCGEDFSFEVSEFALAKLQFKDDETPVETAVKRAVFETEDFLPEYDQASEGD